MPTIDFITELFCRRDDAICGIEKHSQAHLYPSEIVTLGFLFALKGVGERADRIPMRTGGIHTGTISLRYQHQLTLLGVIPFYFLGESNPTSSLLTYGESL